MTCFECLTMSVAGWVGRNCACAVFSGWVVCAGGLLVLS